jgi:hypothetical protein
MPADPRHLPEQEHSIKAREHEMYVRPLSEADAQVRKPFPVYLHETPAEPLSTATKTILWIAGVLVVIVFLAAIWRVSYRRTLKPKKPTAPPANRSVALEDQPIPRLAIDQAFGYLV